MDRRRAAAALLALAACFACSSAAPTASNTALDLHEGPSEGCYYNFQHYGEGDRIMTNEPCLNCTCHNRMLMCYLRVCPFTKAIGQDCTVEKRADQCCPIVTCPDVPVDLLTSTSTSSPAEYGTTGVGKLDKYGCSIHNKYFPEGSKVPSSPNKPCEHCYCIRNMTTCVMQECTLHVDGCTPIYHKDVCCPVRYSCDHSEDEIPLLDDMTTTVRPTQGFLLTTTTMMPVTQMTQDCIHDEQIFPDGASIKTDKACEHCYCMKGDIVCVVQECGTPMENEGKNCTSLPPRQGQCCPDTYICEGDEPSLDLTTETIDLTSAPPRRIGVEGSGYRNEPDEPFTERGPYEQDIEGSGDISETDIPTKVSSTIRDELLLTTTEKEAVYSQTTEAQKVFNIITDKVSEQESAVTFAEDSFTGSTESIIITSTESKATIAGEIIKSDDVTSKHEDDIINTETPFYSYEGDKILPTDISKEKETSPEQSTSMDEHSGYTVTETTTSIKKESETIFGSTEIVAPDNIITTEHPIIISTTEKDNTKDDASEMSQIDIDNKMTNADVIVTEQNKPDFGYSTEKQLNVVDIETTLSSNKDIIETTSINPVNNEVDYIPGRIPGEGDCLLNGVTYNNNTSVPSTNNCHTGCKCISSIVKCDPIICSPPPEYMENMNDCQTSYDSPDACCPTYVCSAKETSLPQSHSQTSVTESSKPVAAEECNGNDCSSSEVKQPLSESHKICESGNCESGPKQNECGTNGCKGEEQPPLEHPLNCSGEKCLVSPTVLCDGENCEPKAPTEDKDVDDKNLSISPSETICNDANGCENIKDTSPAQDECKDETCRRKETSESETNIPAECSGTQCKTEDEQKIPLIEPTIAPVTEYIFNEKTTETTSGDIQKTASPVPNIIISEKVITTESTTNIDTESATVQVQLPDKTLTDKMITEDSIKLTTMNVVSTDKTVTKIDDMDRIVNAITDTPQEEITKSETSPTEYISMSDSATVKIKTTDDASTEQESYTRAPGLDQTEAFTESKLVDYTTEKEDTSSQEYTKEVSQTTTQKSETHSDIYETKSDESFTKLPIVMDTEKEIHTMEMPNIPANEITVPAEPEDYPMTTENLEAISASDEKVGITLQPINIQENIKPELPESAIEIGDENNAHAEFIPTDTKELTTEITQDDKSEDGNKFTTVKSVTLAEVSENSTPVKSETQSILLETVSSESTTPIEIISSEIHKSYTEMPEPIETKSDIAIGSDSYTTVILGDSDNQFIKSTTPSSGTKQPEEFSTKLDETISGDSQSEIENQKYGTTEETPSVMKDDKLNVELNFDVTERQTTITLTKDTDESEIEQEIQTKLPKGDELTERTELEMTTESHKEMEMSLSPFDNEVTNIDLDKHVTVTESAHQYTSNESPQPVSELISKDQLLDVQTSTTPQDISQIKDITTAAVLTDESEIEITSSTDKNIIKITSSSDESVTEAKYITDVAGGEELTTQLPREKIEQHHPTKDFKLTTEYVEKTEIPIETTTTTTSLITEEKQQIPEIPVKAIEEEDETVKDKTTAVPLFTKEIIDEDILSTKLPEVISQNEDTTDNPTHEEKATTGSVYNIKEEEKTENNLEEDITRTTTSNIHISESITEKTNIQPQEHPEEESSNKGSSEKPDVNENDLITESPYSQTGSIDSEKYSTIPSDEYKLDQKPKLPVSETNDDNESISTNIPLLSQDDEIITQKIPISGTIEKESATEKDEYDVISDKNEQPAVTISTEINTDHYVFQNHVTDDNQIEVLELSTPVSYLTTPQPKTTEISPTIYDSEMQHTGINTSVQEENEKQSSSEVPKLTTEMQFGSELTFEGMPTSHQTTSSSNSDIEIEDARTTESILIKQEDLPVNEEVSVDTVHTISDETYTSATKLDIDIVNELMTTEVVPIQSEELPKHPETESMPTVLPELDTTLEEKDISKIESATLSYLTTESLITSKPSLITSTEVSKTDTTKLSDMSEEQPLPSEKPELVMESTPRTESETTEKQYITKSDQEEIPKIPEPSEEQSTAQSNTEIVSKQDDSESATTEKQYVTKSSQDDIPKIPMLVDEQSTSQSDIESVTKLDDTEAFVTEKQYVTKSDQEEVPKIPKLPEEQSTDQTYTEIVSKKEEAEPFTTERSYETKLDQEVPKPLDQIEEQSTSRIDTESVTKLEDTEPLVTEKQYETNSDQEKVPKIPVLIDEQSTSQTHTEGITALNDIEPYTTEKQYGTESIQGEVPKIPEPSEEQSTARTDTEIVSKQDEAGSITTEKQYVTKSDQDEVPKIPESSEEQTTAQSDTELVSKQDDSGSITTEKQYVTKSDQEEVPKITESSEEQSTAQSDTELVSKQDESGTITTEKQYVPKSDQEEVPKIPEHSEEQSTTQTDTELVSKQDDSGSITTEKQYVTKSDQEEVPKIPESSEEQSTARTDTELVSKQDDFGYVTTEKQYVTKSEQDEVPKIPQSSEEQTTAKSDTELISKQDDSGSITTEKQYVTKSDQDEVPKIPESSEEQSTAQSDTELVSKQDDSGSITTEKQYVTKSDQDEVPKIPESSEEQSTAQSDTEIVRKQDDSESATTERQYVTKSSQDDIPKIPVLVGEQSTSQSDIESVTKLDDTEPFVTETQYVTKSDQEEVPKIPALIDGESTSQSDMESITKLNDIEPYTTEKQYVTVLKEELPETPDLPKEQSTDRTDIEDVSKIEDSGPFITERPHVTLLEQEVPKTPAQIDDQSTSRYDSETVTKLENTEPYVTEKEYMLNPDQEEPSKITVVSDEQSTSRIDTESVTKLEDSGTDHEDISSHKLDTDVTKPEQDSKSTEKTITEPLSYPETTIKSVLGDSDILKPSEDTTEIISTDSVVSTSIPEKVETPIETDNEKVNDFEKYSTERNVQTSAPVDEIVTLVEVTDAKPFETEDQTPSKSSTEEEGIYSETTPYSVLLEEHTHPVLEDTSSNIPIEEGTTTARNEVQPERGDQIPDIPETNDEYEQTTARQTEGERTTSYEKISSPIAQNGDNVVTTNVEKITSETVIQDEDKKYSPSMEDEGLTTPIFLPPIKDKEEHTTPPTMSDREKTTLSDIIVSSEEPEFTSSSSKGEGAQELLPSSTSKLQEESTTRLPPSEDKYKEKPLISSSSPSSSETPDILGEPHEEEHLPDFPSSGTGGGYGQEPDYVEEDQAFGPGTCRYGGKVYVSAQQIPRDDPCDFCFCFRSDIICLQQSCPPPIHGCHEEPIQGFCCPRYECPVSMATTVNVTTTTTTTTTTLPPHFLPHAYKGAAQRRGCQIKGHSYKVGEVVRASSGPCLHCTCGGDGQMKCDPKACTPEPMLRQMIAAAVSAKRRR